MSFFVVSMVAWFVYIIFFNAIPAFKEIDRCKKMCSPHASRVLDLGCHCRTEDGWRILDNF